jgi:hypothetical protein
MVGLGHISEVADGNAPHRPPGCIAQHKALPSCYGRLWKMFSPSLPLRDSESGQSLANPRRSASMPNHRIKPDLWSEGKSNTDRRH